MPNMKFIIRTKNKPLLALLYSQVNKMLNKKFKSEMQSGKAILVLNDESIEVIATDPKLQEQFSKSFKKNMRGMAKMLQGKMMSKLYGDFSMDMVPC